MTSCAVEVSHVSKLFRVDERVVHALEDVSLRAKESEFVSLVGPSGCGKSTLLSLICGLMAPDEGSIRLAGLEGDRLGRVGFMPQQDLLMPWRRLMDNLLLGPEIQGRDGAAAEAEARELLPLFGLEGFERSYPSELSGGMRQRAALLRTMLCHPSVIALDEPFGALDALTRRAMRDWLLQVWRRFGQTVLFVTHDVDEALYLSDRVLIMSPRPGSILMDLEIRLPRPRRPQHLEGAGAAQLRHTILSALGL